MTESLIAATRALREFSHRFEVPGDRWIRLQCSEPSRVPTPEWFIRLGDGHGQSTAALPEGDTVFATVTFLPVELLAEAIAESASVLDDGDRLQTNLQSVLLSAGPHHSERVFDSLYGRIRTDGVEPDIDALLHVFQSASEGVTELRQMRTAGIRLYGSISVSERLIRAARQHIEHDDWLLPLIYAYSNHDGNVWSRLGRLATELVQLRLAPVILDVVEEMRQEASDRLAAASRAFSIPGWAAEMYAAFPLLVVAHSLSSLVASTSPGSERVRAANVARAEEERANLVRDSLLHFALDALEGSEWIATRRHLLTLVERDGAHAATRYASSQVVGRTLRYPLSALPSLLEAPASQEP